MKKWYYFYSSVNSVRLAKLQYYYSVRLAKYGYSYRMGRKPRIHYSGALYHVMLRGNAGQDIFFDDTDRYRFLLFLQEGVERLGFRIHAFCLMTNHIHVALQVEGIPLSRIMQNLALRYTRWINWRQKRSGHVFQGRYKAVLIDADSYLTQLVAYLHLNPVRAHMTEKPGEYPWDSHGAYMGLQQIPWLTTEVVLSQFSKRVANARRLFCEFTQNEKDDGHRPEFHGTGLCDDRIFGEASFIDVVLRNTEDRPPARPSLNIVLDVVSTLYDLDKRSLKAPGQGLRISEARAMAAWGVLGLSDATLTELGREIGRDVTTLSSAVRRLVERLKKDS